MILPTEFLQRPFAHRTLHDITDNRPENSLAGARAALSAGYAIEVDLQLSKDGQPVVFHDYSLERQTGENGAVAQRTAKELSAVRLTHGKEGIPTFADLLRLVSGQVPLLVELKDQDGALGPNTGALEKATCELIRSYQGSVAVMSFNPHSVAKCSDYAPEVPRGLVTETFSRERWELVPQARLDELTPIPDYDRVGACFISHRWQDLQSSAVAKIHAKGGSVQCWTVKSREDERQARQVADNVTFEQYLAEI
ncbi:MAG: phosphodiesterase [Rhodobacteraceae bacterium]|nr:phosphodiesterase [Paracoccaceae bacterium]